MGNWTIKVLNYGYLPCDKGKLTPGYDDGLILKNPFLGYLLENGKETVLVDAGVNEEYFANGGGWGGRTPVAGSQYVLDALKKEGKRPEDIDMVIYTHLHNDHAGNCHLFHDAVTLYQRDEYINLTNPLPNQLAGREYDLGVIGRLEKLKNKLVIDGDLELPNGLRIYKTPGHTKGSQSILVDTIKGPRIIIGDLCARYFALFPNSDHQVQADGSVVQITPMNTGVCPVFVSPLIYDHFAFFDSYNKIKALVPGCDPKYFLPGHEPSLLYTGVL